MATETRICEDEGNPQVSSSDGRSTNEVSATLNLPSSDIEGPLIEVSLDSSANSSYTTSQHDSFVSSSMHLLSFSSVPSVPPVPSPHPALPTYDSSEEEDQLTDSQM
jgi:hypothetical protein